MARVRLAAYAALMFALAWSATAAAVPADMPPADVPVATVEPLAAVAWPPSSGLLVAEVMTGGTSASDEFVELTNASAAAIDLAGLEVVYVTSSGTTVTRKASWTTTLLLDPGRHLLLANGLGAYASLADVTYSGGLAATGGAVAVRAIGGAPIDSVGWGDAASAFVEGSAVSAPAAGRLDRAPAGSQRWKRRRHQRQRCRLRAQHGAHRPEPRSTPGAGAHPDAHPHDDRHADCRSHRDADSNRDPDTHSDPTPESDAEPDASPHRDPTTTPTPAVTVTPSPTVTPSRA